MQDKWTVHAQVLHLPKIVLYQTAHLIIITTLLVQIKCIFPILLDAAALKLLMNFCFRVSAFSSWMISFHCITCILASNTLKSIWMKSPKWVMAIKISRPKQKQNPHQGRIKVEKEYQLLQGIKCKGILYKACYKLSQK